VAKHRKTQKEQQPQPRCRNHQIVQYQCPIDRIQSHRSCLNPHSKLQTQYKRTWKLLLGVDQDQRHPK